MQILKNFNLIKINLYSAKFNRTIYSTQKLLLRNDMNKCFSGKKSNNEPLEFLSSKAKTYDSYDTFISKSNRDAPRSQPTIIIASLSIFLFYFLYLREENDLDEMIYAPVDNEFVKLPPAVYIGSKIKEYEKYGLDTSKIKNVIVEKEPKK
jgi:hypothetical protein